MRGEGLLLRAGWLVTGCDQPVRRDGAVLVEEGLVTEVGDGAEMAARHPGAEVLGGAHDALMPGLVNAHHHSLAATHLQQGVADDVLEPWLLRLAVMRRVQPRLQVLAAAARQLRAGVTACVDMVSHGGGAADFAAHLDAVLDAYRESGLRAAVAAGFGERAHLVHGPGEDARFLASLPGTERALAERLLPGPGRLDADDYLALMEERMRGIGGEARVRLWFGPPGPVWTTEHTLQRICERAEALDTRLQTHVDESLYEKLAGPRFAGKDTVLALAELGVLSPRFTLAHGVWLTEAEIEALAEHGAAVSHNPGSNLRLRAGIAPLAALLAKGVTVGLGMDGTTLADEEDGFAEMRLALRLAGSPRVDEPAPRPRELFRLATEGGAALMGLGRRLGRIQTGRSADLVLLDRRRLSQPWLAPEADPLELLVLRARAGDVHTVLVGGEVVLADGRPTHFDEPTLLEEVARQLAAAPPPHAGAALRDRLLPHLRRWYAAWEQPPAAPWVTRDSRR